MLYKKSCIAIIALGENKTNMAFYLIFFFLNLIIDLYTHTIFIYNFPVFCDVFMYYI